MDAMASGEQRMNVTFETIPVLMSIPYYQPMTMNESKS